MVGFTSLIFLTSCSPFRKSKISSCQDRMVPPNCIKISENYFVDKTDIKNIDYLEFMFWHERIFGAKSPEYQFILPDSIRNLIPDDSYNGRMTDYYVSLKQEDLDKPLSKISDEQFRRYTQWRTDRVYEMLLSRFSILPYDTAQTAGHFFTIDHYYSGIYSRSKPVTLLAFIPDYRIPTPEEISLIKQNKTFNSKSISPWTGYRNVCQWVKIEAGAK